ncbi:hypothetical protein [Glycomyces tritici]|uniref:Uncharacterized protein n=1 Tax=Glycomyces tritici TaxID=2665176 RepID=A0ABT7YVQ8_9ACTN|nr:hypothetical protein [Glycomyces tritici]MDN3242672.1 hypothetical protein [Glycomyces tritici]
MTETPAVKPEAVTAAQTLLWVLFAAGLGSFAPYLYLSVVPPAGTAFALDLLAGAAVCNLLAAALPVLAVHVGRRRWAARWAVLAVCTASVLVFGGYLLLAAADPFFRENGDMSMAGAWALAFVALPTAIVACLLTPAAVRWFRPGA